MGSTTASSCYPFYDTRLLVAIYLQGQLLLIVFTKIILHFSAHISGFSSNFMLKVLLCRILIILDECVYVPVFLQGTNMLSRLLHVQHPTAKQAVITAIDLLGDLTLNLHLFFHIFLLELISSSFHLQFYSYSSMSKYNCRWCPKNFLVLKTLLLGIFLLPSYACAWFQILGGPIHTNWCLPAWPRDGSKLYGSLPIGIHFLSIDKKC